MTQQPSINTNNEPLHEKERLEWASDILHNIDLADVKDNSVREEIMKWLDTGEKVKQIVLVLRTDIYDPISIHLIAAKDNEACYEAAEALCQDDELWVREFATINTINMLLDYFRVAIAKLHDIEHALGKNCPCCNEEKKKQQRWES